MTVFKIFLICLIFPLRSVAWSGYTCYTITKRTDEDLTGTKSKISFFCDTNIIGHPSSDGPIRGMYVSVIMADASYKIEDNMNI